MKRLISLVTIAMILSSLLLQLKPVQAASRADTPEMQVQALLSRMTTAEKIGQLFLVSFKGTDVSENTQIYNLIATGHVGGVILSGANDNFPSGEGSLAATQQMIQALQSINATPIPEEEGTATPPFAYIPLFIGLDRAGNGSPNDQILSCMTQLPDEMAIGATWNTENARSAGNVLGQELNALGVNFLLGPSLDVLDSISSAGSQELGVQSFGGSPYWVGEMGKAFISGVHTGSNNRIAVIAKNFPGRGDSDRPLADEVGTVRKSLEELVKVDLAPFMAVTGNSADPLEVTDGLLITHIRYQGLQGNIRATTRPVSFDSVALNEILSMPAFNAWRSEGGVLISDNLGMPAVRKFFDPNGTSFDARQVIKNAFVAGSDLLYLGNIQSSDDPDPFTTIQRTLDYFVQKYNEDTSFSQQVDQSVSRILAMKMKLYPYFMLSSVVPSAGELDLVGKSDSVSLNIAREGVTLISPSKSELDAAISNPPQNLDRILFIANTITSRQCSTCAETVEFSSASLADAVLRLYGPTAGEQVQKFRLFNYTFDNLNSLLEGGDNAGNLSADMTSANWIVFGFNDLSKDAQTLEIFRKLFTNRSDLVQNKKVIGFAFDAPYFLDATDISKLTAYYALYSKIPVFVDTAARVLFQELRPAGSLPVSVPGAGYDLQAATTPDPNQIIPLMLDTLQSQPTDTGTPTLEPTPSLSFKEGDTLPIRTGVIRDHNGNPVPDGTVVRFLIDTRSASGSVEQVETKTSGGIARTTYKIPSTGLLELKVTAEPAIASQILRVDITNSGGVVTSIEPTPAPSLPPGVEPTPEVTEPVVPIPLTRHERGLPDIADWFVVSISAAGVALGTYFLSSRRFSQRWRIRTAAIMVSCSYLVYLFIAAGVPAVKALVQTHGTWTSLSGAVAGCVLGAAIAAIWYFMEKRNLEANSAKKRDQ